MNKAQLIDAVATATKLTKAQAERTIDATFGTIKTTVRKGDAVKIVGFGTFTKLKWAARAGRNPQTGKAIKIPALFVPKFRAGKEFRTLVK